MMDLQIVETVILVLHVLAALSIIGLVLIQHGKGADMGSGFGSGASATVFGSGGAGTFLTKSTTAIAIAFFLTSFGLAYFAKSKSVSARDVGIPAVIEQRTGAGAITEEMVLPTLDSTDFQNMESELPEADPTDSGSPESIVPED